MSNREDSRRDGKTAGIHLKCGLVFTDKQDRVMIEIVGKAFANLREITGILNGLDDDDEKNTPAEVVKDFLCWGSPWFNLHIKQPEKYEQNLCGNIFQLLDDTEAQKAEAAFNAAGFAVRA